MKRNSKKVKRSSLTSTFSQGLLAISTKINYPRKVCCPRFASFSHIFFKFFLNKLDGSFFEKICNTSERMSAFSIFKLKRNHLIVNHSAKNIFNLESFNWYFD
jgi:hypothetical protein